MCGCDKKGCDSGDRVVCACMGVTYDQVCSAIAGGCRDFEALVEILMVGKGCGHCVGGVKKILAEQLERYSEGKK